MYFRFSFLRGRRIKVLNFITVVVIVGSLLFHFSLEVTSAQTQIPLEAQQGILDKSLSQSPPKFEPPPETEAPEITNGGPKPSKRSLKDAEVGPKFFVKKIKLTGNTVISNARLMPLVNLGGGMDVNLSMLNSMASKISALYSAEGYLLARAFIPKQEIVDGIVEIAIMEGRINKVFVQGNKMLDKEKFKQRMKMAQEESVLQEQTLVKVYNLLNKPGS